MKLVLEALGRLETHDGEDSGWTVEACGICRTDAKMYREGQRDLSLPRVLGHEAVLRRDSDGARFVPWPARSCGRCAPCRAGRENLCEHIRIMGFHFDGAYGERLETEGLRLFPVGTELPAALYAFAEPAACALHALDKVSDLNPGRLAVYGGGTLGLILARLAADRGWEPTVLERNQEKLDRIAPLAAAFGGRALKATEEGDFDLCVNACADYLAFAAGLTKLRSGGSFVHFSGITKNEQLPTNLLNLAHYRELELAGAYGLRPADLPRAVAAIEGAAGFFSSLLEGVVAPGDLRSALEAVLTGLPLKFVLDCRRAASDESALRAVAAAGAGRFPASAPAPDARRGAAAAERAASGFVVPEIPPLDPELTSRARYLMDNKTKPLGSLGKLEELAVRLCGIKNDLAPALRRTALFTFAADHGITEEGVSAYPREVTVQMVANFAAGGAAINVLCRRYGIELTVVDMGVAGDLVYGPAVLDRKVERGTANCALGPAMTEAQAIAALERGMGVVRDAWASGSLDAVGLGEMGIGNTSSATLMMALACGLPVEDLVGRGTGVDDAGLRHKTAVLRKAAELHGGKEKDGLELLRKVGGFEIAGMAGAALAAASLRIPVMLDGLISTAAGVAAFLIDPRVKDYLFVAHRSVERAQAAACALLGLEPLVDLNMRLGEGTGAALGIDLLGCAAELLRDMASFESAGVSRKGE